MDCVLILNILGIVMCFLFGAVLVMVVAWWVTRPRGDDTDKEALERRRVIKRGL